MFLFSLVIRAKNNKSAIKKVSAHKADSINKEYLDWDSVKVNGIISMISNYNDVVRKMGKPDSIGKLSENVNGSYYRKKFQECYFKGLIFEKYSDTIVFSKIDFRKVNSVYLGDNKIHFQSSSTDSDFHNLFPYSFLNAELTGTDMDKYQYIGLPTSSKKTDDSWIFTFNAQTGKLLSIMHADALDPKTEQNK